MVPKGSRYETTGAVTVTDADGRTHVALRLRLPPEATAGYLHTVTAGERLDTLAYRYYRNAEKFWLIADANDETDPDDLLVAGREVRIPPDRTV